MGEGRVFGCVPGLSAKTFDDSMFRKLLLRGITWTARENPLLFDEFSRKIKE
jgi:type 1 glutamine amidotransferase